MLHECLVSLPEEDFVYLGDTAMFPYGSRDPVELRKRIRGIAELLLDGGAKLLVIACNTATSIGEDVAREVAAERGVGVVPVVEPQAEIAAAITANAQVGVLVVHDVKQIAANEVDPIQNLRIEAADVVGPIRHGVTGFAELADVVPEHGIGVGDGHGIVSLCKWCVVGV